MTGPRPSVLSIRASSLSTEAGVRAAVHEGYGLYRLGHPVLCVVAGDGESEPGNRPADLRDAFRRAGVPTATFSVPPEGPAWSARDASAVAVVDRALTPLEARAFADRIDGVERREVSPFTPDGQPARVALLGLGAVGGGVYELARLQSCVEIVAIAVRDPDKPRDVKVDPGCITTDPNAAMAGVDVLVELIGGTGIAGDLVERALGRGISVVTANKALIAERGPALHAIAQRHGAALLYSASVGGSVPVIERVKQGSGSGTNTARDTVKRIRAILNGTTNYLLDELAAGRAFADAIADAQRLGFAEADPTRDVTGVDAADKLRVLGQVAAGVRLNEPDVRRDVLSAETAERAAASRAKGHALRHVATLDLTGDVPAASVRLVSFDPADPLFDVPGEQNAAVIEWASERVEVITGFGAGRYPTAESVMADILTIAAGGRAATA